MDIPLRSTPVMLRRVEATSQTSHQRTGMSWDEFLEELDVLEQVAASTSPTLPNSVGHIHQCTAVGLSFLGERRGGALSAPASDSRTRCVGSASHDSRLDAAGTVHSTCQVHPPQDGDSTHLDVMVEVGARASAGSRAAKEFYDVFGKLDGARKRGMLAGIGAKQASAESGRMRCVLPRLAPNPNSSGCESAASSELAPTLLPMLDDA